MRMPADGNGYNYRSPEASRVRFHAQARAEGQQPYRAVPNLTQFRVFERDDDEPAIQNEVYWPSNQSLWDRTKELENEISALKATIAHLHDRLVTNVEPPPEPVPVPVVEEVAQRVVSAPVPKRRFPVSVRIVDMN